MYGIFGRSDALTPLATTDAAVEQQIEPLAFLSPPLHSIADPGVNSQSDIVGKPSFDFLLLGVDLLFVFDPQDGSIRVGLNKNFPNIVKVFLCLQPLQKALFEGLQVVLADLERTPSPAECSREIVSCSYRDDSKCNEANIDSMLTQQLDYPDYCSVSSTNDNLHSDRLPFMCFFDCFTNLLKSVLQLEGIKEVGDGDREERVMIGIVKGRDREVLFTFSPSTFGVDEEEESFVSGRLILCLHMIDYNMKSDGSSQAIIITE